MNLFLDIETTGLVPKHMEWRKDYKRFPRIVSMAWRLSELKSGEQWTMDTDKGIMSTSLNIHDTSINYYTINQGGRKIPPSATRIHGITDAIASDSPYFIQEVLIKLSNYLVLADKIIGHNLYFDSSIVKANALREFGEDSPVTKRILEGLDKYKRIDIMRKSASYNKGYMTLEKLHMKLFGTGFKAHDSLEDCRAVERCYNELVRLNVLK